MDYPYENLGPEEFQQFCQALLARELPSVQCFPVAQPDGGRDALSYVSAIDASEFVMFQVKYARRPHAETDPHRWLLGILEDEAPKVAKQVKVGATRFYLLTNVPGTAHPGVGSIDKANALLKEHFPIPAEVWWRDDLNRRLDGAWDLKWSYPQLMNGPDLMRSLIESGLGEDKSRRAKAIKAFVTDQYAQDREVKFKQVELQNRLLDLFIDLPIIPPNFHASRKQLGWLPYYQLALSKETTRRIEALDGHAHEDAYFSTDKQQIGAATMLLDAGIQKHVKALVLEGAPGQGKSTITQYVAQVHRMRLLNDVTALQDVPEHHRTSPVRLPFKVDLRDYATWLSRRNPFSGALEDLVAPAGWHKSLEAFLAALVSHHAGGTHFSIEDLHAAAGGSAIVVLLDGLDEVADITRREEVVEEIARASRRLNEIALSAQMIVTSRPAAFANSPGLPDVDFPYFQLDSVTPQLINEYADKWLRARKLQGREHSEVKRILSDKLGQPHLRDLARNPMQLAILLSLIHTRGTSLPDKRTALYDAYMELFFNRESEKSELIREHRDLIIDIHRFIAWTLHGEAEASGGNGSITGDKLEALVTTYLAQEQQDTALAAELFRGMVERVVAIVSRVEGTFEFEVQPLREYFAARYLFESAPYSPPGNEKGGARPDRFDALARDFYWLNVTRFYAGCYSKGELSSLVDRLQELVKESDYKRIAHPRLLAATLLGDWVFAQQPRSMKEVVALVLDGIGLRFLVSSSRRRISGGTPLILPSKSGREELVARCVEILRDDIPEDYSVDLIDVLQSNAGRIELAALWITETRRVNGAKRTRWLWYGAQLGVLATAPRDEVLQLLGDERLNARRVTALSVARRWDVLQYSEEFFNDTVEVIREGDLGAFLRVSSGGTVLEYLAVVLSPSRFAWAFYSPEPIPLSEIWRRHAPSPIDFSPEEWEQCNFQAAQEAKRVIKVASEVAETLARSWTNEIAPWDRLTESIRQEWGETWVALQLAVFAAGIRNPAEKCSECDSLFDTLKPLCRRARFARLRAGMPVWWLRQLDTATTERDKALWAALLITWGSAATVTHVCEDLCSVLDELSEQEWRHLFQTLESAKALTRHGSGERRLRLNVNDLPKTLTERFIAAISLRVDTQTQQALFDAFLLRADSSDPNVLTVMQMGAVEALRGETDVNKALTIVRKSYASGVISDDYSQEYFSRRAPLNWPLAVAKRITDAPHQYPSYLVAISERRCQTEVAREVVPVGKVAKRDGWIFN